jgi:dolichyl-phosphate-mannose-protein mannosyltransferase
MPFSQWLQPSLLFTMSGTVRQRAPKKKTSSNNVDVLADSDPDTVIDKLRSEIQPAVKSEWDYKLALVVVTILAFVTRFYGIRHPNQVVFDEVHFGKVLLRFRHNSTITFAS